MKIKLNRTDNEQFCTGDILAIKSEDDGTIYYKLVIDICNETYLVDLQDNTAFVYRDDWEEAFGNDDLLEIIPSSEIIITRKSVYENN